MRLGCPWQNGRCRARGCLSGAAQAPARCSSQQRRRAGAYRGQAAAPCHPLPQGRMLMAIPGLTIGAREGERGAAARTPAPCGSPGLQKGHAARRAPTCHAPTRPPPLLACRQPAGPVHHDRPVSGAAWVQAGGQSAGRCCGWRARAPRPQLNPRPRHRLGPTPPCLPITQHCPSAHPTPLQARRGQPVGALLAVPA